MDKEDSAGKARRDAYIANLLEERRGYQIRGMDENAKAVTVELARAGHKDEDKSVREDKTLKPETARAMPSTENRPR